jgi:hypothetical protein
MLGITAIAQSPIASLGGTNANVDVTGIQLTTAVGSVSITAIQNPTIQLTTNLLNTQTGAIQVDPDVIVTGEQLSFVIGTYSVSADGNATIVAGPEKELETSVGTVTINANGLTILSGVNATTAVGQVDGVFTVLVSGNELESETGTIGPITGTANVTAATNLLTISDEPVDVSIDVTASITGLTLMTTAVASVTVDLDTPVDLTGQQLSITEGNTGTIAWSNVDPGVSNVWVEVDIAA